MAMHTPPQLAGSVGLMTAPETPSCVSDTVEDVSWAWTAAALTSPPHCPTCMCLGGEELLGDTFLVLA